MPTDSPALLEPDEPHPVRVLTEAGPSDFFLTADHAGRAIPRRLGRLGLTEADLRRHIAWDIGIAGVTERLSAALNATAVLQAYSRLVIDCNRDPSWPTSMPEISETTPIPGNANLSAADRAARIAAVFTPYHHRIAALLDARAAAGRRTILVAMHSFTPVFKQERREMQVGVLYNRDPVPERIAGERNVRRRESALQNKQPGHFQADTQPENALARIMLDLLRAEGDLVVGDNAPYAITQASDYGVPTHGERRGLPHVEIEIRQDLIEDSAGQSAWASRFARLLVAADQRLHAGGN